MTAVLPVAEARSELSQLLRGFRDNPTAQPIFIGSHRRACAVLMPLARYVPDSPAPVSLARLRELRTVIAKLADAAGLVNVRVYGSVARGGERQGSDVDILIEPTKDATLFSLADFELDLEAILGVPVSVNSAAALDPIADAEIIREAVLL